MKILNEIKEDFNKQSSDKKVSLADLIVLAGCAAVEEAIKRAGFDIQVPFRPGRNDTTQELTDIKSFSFLEPVADGFRNYIKPECDIPEEYLLIDKADQLNLTVPQMCVLVGGLRVLGANYDSTDYGVFTDNVGTLSNDFFVNLLDMSIVWKPVRVNNRDIFEGYDRKTGDLVYRGTRVDLIFGSNSELRAQAEFYAQDDNREKFIRDFVEAWDKVMNLDIT